MANNKVAISLILGTLIVIGAIFWAGSQGPYGGGAREGNNVRVENGKQIIEIDAKGGYFPRITSAQANMPTVIRMKTGGTFDCSAALAIPKVGFQQFLPASGITEVEIPPQKSGESLQGICSMGMYNFEVAFK